MRVNTLNGNTDLPGVIKSCLYEKGDHLLQLRTLLHHHRGGSPMLQGAVRARSQLGPQSPAHLGRPNERQKVHPPIRHQGFSILIGANHRLAPLLRQPGLMQEIHQTQARQRGFTGRLHHHRASRCHRRDHLMDDQVNRMIKGTDGRNQAARFTIGVGHAIHRGRVEPHRDLPT